MVTDVLLGWLGALWSWLMGLFPVIDPPDWLAGTGDALTTVTDHIGGMGRWLPFGLLGAVLGTFFLILAAGFVVKVVRIVASFFTAGGGSAG